MSPVTPSTRRLIVVALGTVACLAIVGEIALVVYELPTSEALLAIATGATGALAGAMLPGE